MEASRLRGWLWSTAVVGLAAAAVVVSAERGLRAAAVESAGEELTLSGYALKLAEFLWQTNDSSYEHVWPPMEFGWKIIVGSIIGFFGSAFGSVGGVGGGGIYVPMLTLIIGFDPKSSAAMSKCMIMGAAASTVYYNLKLRHPTLDMPIIDYDLALLCQPMLLLGISIGVVLNVVFADWMVTVLLIILFLATSTRAFVKGLETWNKETILKKEAARKAESNGDYKALSSGPGDDLIEEKEVSIIQNIRWKEFGLLMFVWIAFLTLQIVKNYTATCTLEYWIVNLLQIPVAVGVTMYQGVRLYTGKAVIRSYQDQGNTFRILQLVIYGILGVSAGVVGGLLGIGGGSILGPLFLELGVPPQVSSATATFAMSFSSSMSVVEYYLLKRFPVPYALYLIAVAAVSAIIGQLLMKKVLSILGRASIIIFVLAGTIFVSAISLGGVGISNMIQKIQHHEYMGFESLCKYQG